jgi:phosphoglycerol transferase MdoB-like AlkP superfamily enzyme
MVCIILVFVIPVLVNGIIAPIVSIIAGETLAVGGVIQMLTLFTSFLISLLLLYISKKCKADWLDEFAMSVSMLGAMIMSVVWTNLLS